MRGYVPHTALKANNSNMWYLDSGCSRHMCDNKALFDTVTKCDGGLVTFGDGNTSRIVGKDEISVIPQPKIEFTWIKLFFLEYFSLLMKIIPK